MATSILRRRAVRVRRSLSSGVGPCRASARQSRTHDLGIRTGRHQTRDGLLSRARPRDAACPLPLCRKGACQIG